MSGTMNAWEKGMLLLCFCKDFGKSINPCKSACYMVANRKKSRYDIVKKQAG